MGARAEINITLGVIPDGVKDITVTLANAKTLKEYGVSSKLRSRRFSLTKIDTSDGSRHFIEIALIGANGKLLDRIFIDSDVRPGENELSVNAIAGAWKLERPLPATIDGTTEYDTAVIQPLTDYECQATHGIHLFSSRTGRKTREGSICYTVDEKGATIYDQREIPIRQWDPGQTFTQDILVVNTNYDNLNCFKGHKFPADLAEKIHGNNPYRIVEKNETLETVFHFATIAVRSPLRRIDSTLENFDNDIAQLSKRISKKPVNYTTDNPNSFPVRIMNFPGFSFYRIPKHYYKVFPKAYSDDVHYTIADNCEYHLYKVPAQRV